MLEQVTQKLIQVSAEPLGLFFALLLGVVSAAASACCALPAVGVLAGYSGTQPADNHGAVYKSVLYFTLGIIISLMIIGGIAGFVGQVAQISLGKYWKMFAGVAAVFLGLAVLKLLPFNFSFGNTGSLASRAGKLGSVAAGLVLGGLVVACSLSCNPGIFIVTGAAVLQGRILWAVAMLLLFSIGFSIPLGAVLLGISLGKFSLAARGADTAIRWASGIILVGAGFYFLVTV